MKTRGVLNLFLLQTKGRGNVNNRACFFLGLLVGVTATFAGFVVAFIGYFGTVTIFFK